MKKYKLWALALRVVAIGLPGLLWAACYVGSEKLEGCLDWLVEKLPDPRKDS